MMHQCFVYITCRDMAEARQVGSTLVEERYCACVNILDGMTSMFHWEGSVQAEQETILIAKTRRDLLDELTERVREVHSYEVPCIVALPLVSGNMDFLSWIDNSVRPAER